MSQLDLVRLRAANVQLASRRSQKIEQPTATTTDGWLRALAAETATCADLPELTRREDIPFFEKMEYLGDAPDSVCCAKSTSRVISSDGAISFFPDLGLALLREEKAAIGRIYLLLRHIDQAGKGWVSIEDARSLLTKKGATLRVCGWRQLRNLLRAGQGVFWERDKERVWLRSLARVAAALGVERMAYRPIALPITALLDGIGSVRAHFYASFHSGRHDTECAKPIARATLTELSGVAPDSQRNYEQQTGITPESNFAVGDVASAEKHKAACWQRGDHVFIFTDKQGAQGKQGQTYLAWQLPNSYHGVHQQKPRTQKRRINRQLADLLIARATGNDESQRMRRYFVSGAAAVCNGEDSAEIYLQQGNVWRCL